MTALGPGGSSPVTFPADAVVLATGGNGLVYGRSTMSMICTGSAVSRAYQAGAWYGNGEFVQVHPTAIPGADKLRLMSESARGEDASTSTRMSTSWSTHHCTLDRRICVRTVKSHLSSVDKMALFEVLKPQVCNLICAANR